MATCNNIGSLHDVEDHACSVQQILTESLAAFSEGQVGNLRHVSGHWGGRQMNGPKGGVLEATIQTVLDAHPGLVTVHHHTDNPNAHGIDHIAYHRASGTLLLIEAKNFGRGDGTPARVYARSTPTLHRSANDLLQTVDMSHLTMGEQRAVRAAALNGHVVRALVTGPNCDAQEQPGIEHVSFDQLVGVDRVA